MNEIFGVLNDYLLFINIIFACIIIFYERRRPVFTLFWITLLLLTSYFGFIMYLFFGMSFKKRRNLKKYYIDSKDEKISYIEEKKLINIKKWGRLSRYLDKLFIGNMNYNNNFKLYDDGQNFFEHLFDEIKKAKEYIYMEYYIFDDDEVGEPIYNLLLEKIKEGLDIRIIVDGVGTRGISKKRIKSLRENGIMIEIFFPSYFPFIKIGNLRANYRNHRKITIIDSEICFSGGINIGKDYIGKGGLGQWRDIGFSIQGEAVIDYLYEFERSWKFLKKDVTHIPKIAVKKKTWSTLTPMQVVSSGPNYKFHTIKDTILTMIIKAEYSIHIQTPYFIPDESILDALKVALISGVQVKIVIPKVGDHAFVYWANQYFYGELLELGAKVYKYQGGFIHSKLVVIDSEIAFVGTANFDYRSMYQNFEINLLLLGKDVISLEKRIAQDILNSKIVTKEEYKKRNKKEKIFESISKLISPIL